MLDMKKGVAHWKARGLDFTRIFHSPVMPAEVARYCVETQDHGLDRALDHQLIEKSQAGAREGREGQLHHADPQREPHRRHDAVGRDRAPPHPRRAADDTIHVQFTGVAGQSFGAFLARGVTLDLVGDANDYVGKGLSGGRIIVRSPNDFRGFGPEHIIAGNTVLYGAIEGEAYFNGVAGERFAVRNSGAAAVVEGTGDHCCEYMTGGTVVVLGPTGRNFAAGMSGGIAYVYDADGDFARRCNLAMVTLEPVISGVDQENTVAKAHWHSASRGAKIDTDEAILRGLIESHFRYTGSFRAREILAAWPKMREKFVKVFPTEYRRALGEMYAKRVEAAALPPSTKRKRSQVDGPNDGKADGGRARAARRPGRATAEGGSSGKVPADRQR